ncbi:SIS domain-containing protein [Pseudomonas sp. LTJR-52]|uniref:SIS domain-containing protein n=1 Tax=Pseudomonas sp. LTJR-52 TaxID=2479392 RepID=UPI000EFD3343|nr:SIS domain-containing protein [Pseudomonas sp. LTJR-52]AYN97080.1 SIS domain-containing protein [Pseudomonas sp. LTJR-52]
MAPSRPLKVDVQLALDALGNRPIDTVFFVACGGSLAVMHPNKFLFDQHASTLRAECYNADEFVMRHPRSLGPRSLVVLCSQTGTTRETVKAAAFAREHGAFTIGATEDRESALARAVDQVVKYDAHYTTGIPIDAANSNYAVLYQLGAALIDRYEGLELLPSLLHSLDSLQAVIDRALDGFAQTAACFAERYAQEPVIYTLSSGADYGAAYSFSICVLMEMQWIHSQAIHANEFFHGPFEVVDPNTPFILLLGLDDTRPLEERAQQFLERHGSKDKTLVLDARAFDFTGIDSQWQGNLAPLVFFELLWSFAYQLAERRGHPMLVSRRYMKKIDY